MSYIIISNNIINYSTYKNLKGQLNKYNTIIGKHCSIENGVRIGENCKIGLGVKIGKGSIISDNIIIEDEVKIGINVNIGDGCRLNTGSTIGDNVIIKDNQSIGAECIIGDNVLLEDTFYLNSARHEITYCGDGKMAIGCQIFNLSYWDENYLRLAKLFEYSDDEVKECKDRLDLIKKTLDDRFSI